MGSNATIGATGGKVGAFENQLPCFAAIGGLVETAIRRIAPQRAGHGGINRVAVLWTDHDLRDALRIVQTGVRPRLAAVGRFVNSVADRHAVSRPRFAGSDPDIFCVLGIERDRANRLHRLFVEHRPVSSSAIVRFPNAAAGRADEKRDLP